MKKNLLFIILCCTTATLSAQSAGNVGINTVTPTATLHVNSQGSTATTQALKVDNADGTNLLTINNDGTVSGAAAVNLSSGTAAAPKGSGIFTATASSFNNCFLSPNGNTSIALTGSSNDPGFYTVAQAVPYNTVVDKLNFHIRATATYYGTNPILVQLYVNGVPANLTAAIFLYQYTAGQTYSAQQTNGSVSLVAGDLIAYRILGLGNTPLIGYLSMRYTEE